MAKAPAFQFYVKDWLSDPELQCVSASTKGIWIDALCYMWEAPERGKLTGTREELGKLLRATNGDFIQFLEDAKKHKFCDLIESACDALVTERNKNVTLINRRMFREQKSKDNHALRQERYRDKKRSDAEVTPPSPSPSPTSLKEIKNKYGSRILLTETEYKKLCEKFSKEVTDGFIDQMNEKLDSKYVAYTSHYYTILRWERKGWLDKPKGKESIFD